MQLQNKVVKTGSLCLCYRVKCTAARVCWCIDSYRYRHISSHDWTSCLCYEHYSTTTCRLYIRNRTSKTLQLWSYVYKQCALTA